MKSVNIPVFNRNKCNGKFIRFGINSGDKEPINKLGKLSKSRKKLMSKK